MDLNKMMAKLLEGKYPSSAAFQVDMQLSIEDPTSGNGKKVLDHVNKFMAKLPKSLHRKRQADETAGEDSVAPLMRISIQVKVRFNEERRAML